MSELGVADAARSNAAWCDAVCSAHGSPGRLHPAYWLTRGPAPPYYPNLVTLDPAVEPALTAARELGEARPSASWAVKDSFGVLPLEQLGFRLLFEAEWIVRPAAPGRPGRGARRGRWRRVETESALSSWEAAWGESLGQPRVFLPALLRRSDVAILAAVDGDGVVTAGVAAHRTDEAVGLSNFFARGDDEGALRAECIEAAGDAFPGLPFVGYEAGRRLEESRARGFASIGALRVWAKDA